MRINEINITPHFNDPSSIENLNANYEFDGNKTKFIDNIGISGKLYARYWPLREMNMLYFLDYDDNLIGEAHVQKHNNIQKIKNVVSINSIYIKKEFRSQNLGFDFYKFLLLSRYKILSDQDHTPSSQKLWQRLADNFEVWLYDINEDKPIKILNDVSEAYESDNFLMLAKI